MIQKFEKIENVRGNISLPGDKSISHRAVMFGSMADGKSVVRNCLNSADVNSTISCFTSLGADIRKEGEALIIEGCGIDGLNKPETRLDAGNSGTTARLISGILAAQDFDSVLIGDESLSGRPMKRILDPLRAMGAVIEAEQDNFLPLHFKGESDLKAIEFTLPVASAQVKSCVLLAGLFLSDKTIVKEPFITRNHTENLLNLDVEEENNIRLISVSSSDYPRPDEFIVPSDISTAAFFVVLALLSKNSELRINNLLLNKTRSGFIELLKEMGGSIIEENIQTINGERVGDIIVKSSSMQNINIRSDIVPNIIDEIPILSVAGLLSEGEFEIGGAGELRVKESDRINSICENFRKLGVNVEENDEGFKLSGNITVKEAHLESYGDHRIAMAFGILGLLSETDIRIKDFECVRISNPDFLTQIKSIT